MTLLLLIFAHIHNPHQTSRDSLAWNVNMTDKFMSAMFHHPVASAMWNKQPGLARLLKAIIMLGIKLYIRLFIFLHQDNLSREKYDQRNVFLLFPFQYNPNGVPLTLCNVSERVGSQRVGLYCSITNHH